MVTTINQITAPRVDFLDANTGKISREWYMFLYNLYVITGAGTGITAVVNGGTGLGIIPTNGQLLIGNGTGYALNTLGTGVGISVTNGAGTIVIANTGVLSNIAGAGISVSSTTGNVTISNTGVLSWSGGLTGLTPSTATTGAITLGGKLAIGYGGTNGTATPTAGAVAYGTGTAYGFTAAGTSGQVLTSAGASTPTWTTPTTGTVTSVSGTGTVNGITLTGTVTSSGSLTLGGTLGGIGNSQLTNSTISGVALGGNLFNLTAGTGVSFSSGTTYNGSAAITITATGSGGTVTSVTGTSPVVSSGGTTPAISLAAAYGDTLNPYASKTANYVLAAPNGSAGVPTFRALVAADVPGSALTKTDDTNVTLTLGGSPTTALLNAASLTLGWTGQLGISRGGTNTSTAPSAYGVVYGNSGGTAYTSLANGTTGQVLTATTSGAPSWAAPATSGTVTSVSVVSANGFAGTVATATTTPAITLTTSITGVLKGNGTAISAAVANTDYVPLSTVLTKTADYTITGTDTWIINNKTGSALTLTFPAASSWTGRSITVKNMQAQAVNSASSNIVPIDSTTAGTAILLGVVGNWATIMSDGTNWVIMQAAPNNILLLE